MLAPKVRGLPLTALRRYLSQQACPQLQTQWINRRIVKETCDSIIQLNRSEQQAHHASVIRRNLGGSQAAEERRGEERAGEERIGAAEMSEFVSILGHLCRNDGSARVLTRALCERADSDACIAAAKLVLQLVRALRADVKDGEFKGDIWGVAAAYGGATHCLQSMSFTQWKVLAVDHVETLAWLHKIMMKNSCTYTPKVEWNIENDALVHFFRALCRNTPSLRVEEEVLPLVTKALQCYSQHQNTATTHQNTATDAPLPPDLANRLIPVLRGCYFAWQQAASKGNSAVSASLGAAWRESFSALQQLTAQITAACPPRFEAPIVSRAVVDIFAHGMRSNGPLRLESVESAYQALLSSLSPALSSPLPSSPLPSTPLLSSPLSGRNPNGTSHYQYQARKYATQDIEEQIQCFGLAAGTLGQAQLISPEFWMAVESSLPAVLSAMRQKHNTTAAKQRSMMHRVAKSLVQIVDGGVKSLSGSFLLYSAILEAWVALPECLSGLDEASLARCVSLMALSGYSDYAAVKAILDELNKRKLRPELQVNVLSSLVALDRSRHFKQLLEPWLQDCRKHYQAQATVDPAFLSQLFFIESAGAISDLSSRLHAAPQGGNTRTVAKDYRVLLESTLHSSKKATLGQLDLHQEAYEAACEWGRARGLGLPQREFITSSSLSIDLAWPEAKIGIEIQGLPHFLPRSPTQQIVELAQLTHRYMPDMAYVPLVRARTHVARSGRSSFARSGHSRAAGVLTIEETEAQQNFATVAHRQIMSTELTPRTKLKLSLLKRDGWTICSVPIMQASESDADWKKFVATCLSSTPTP